jgi:hypothetical protein
MSRSWSDLAAKHNILIVLRRMPWLRVAEQPDATSTYPDSNSSGVHYVHFDDALTKFEAFARAQGVAEQVVLISSDDAFVIRGELYVRIPEQKAAYRVAMEAYKNAARRRLGVVIAAAGRLSTGGVVIYVYGPQDPSEAELLMFSDGLKLSLPQVLPAAVAVGNIRSSVLRYLRGRLSAVSSAEDRMK